jgi:hypothetical protein
MMYLIDKLRLGRLRARVELPKFWRDLSDDEPLEVATNHLYCEKVRSQFSSKDTLRISYCIDLDPEHGTLRHLTVRARKGLAPPPVVAHIGAVLGIHEPFFHFAPDKLEEQVHLLSRVTRTEVGCVLKGSEVCFWQDDQLAVADAMPDEPSLHEQLWEHRHEATAHAHVHSWFGSANPSGIDLPTYERIERHVLARPFTWYVVTFNAVAKVWRPNLQADFQTEHIADPGGWTDELRRRSLR